MSAFRLFGLFLRRALLCRRLCGSLAAFPLFRPRLLRGGLRLGCGFRRLGLVVLLRLCLCGRLLRRLLMFIVVVMTAAVGVGLEERRVGKDCVSWVCSLCSSFP